MLNKKDKKTINLAADIVQSEIDKLMEEYTKTKHKTFNYIDGTLNLIRMLIETRNRLRSYFDLNW